MQRFLFYVSVFSLFPVTAHAAARTCDEQIGAWSKLQGPVLETQDAHFKAEIGAAAARIEPGIHDIHRFEKLNASLIRASAGDLTQNLALYVNQRREVLAYAKSGKGRKLEQWCSKLIPGIK